MDRMDKRMKDKFKLVYDTATVRKLPSSLLKNS